MQMQVVVLGALTLVNEHPERSVERLLSGAADPKEAVPLLVHPDQALLETARPEHDLVHPDQ
jgi:hypothetical protein